MFWQNHLSFNHLIGCELAVSYDLKSLSYFEFWNISKDYTVFILFPPFGRGMSKDKGISLTSWSRGGWIFYDTFCEFIIKILMRIVNSSIAFSIYKRNIDIQIWDNKSISWREDVVVEVLRLPLHKFVHS